MNLVNVSHTMTKMPVSWAFQPKGKVCARHRSAQQTGFFVPDIPATAMDAIDNGPASGSFHGKTGETVHHVKPRSVYACDCTTEPAGDKMAGIKRILMGSRGNSCGWAEFYLTLG